MERYGAALRRQVGQTRNGSTLVLRAVAGLLGFLTLLVVLVARVQAAAAGPYGALAIGFWWYFTRRERRRLSRRRRPTEPEPTAPAVWAGFSLRPDSPRGLVSCRGPGRGAAW